MVTNKTIYNQEFNTTLRYLLVSCYIFCSIFRSRHNHICLVTATLKARIEIIVSNTVVMIWCCLIHFFFLCINTNHWVSFVDTFSFTSYTNLFCCCYPISVLSFFLSFISSSALHLFYLFIMNLFFLARYQVLSHSV